MRWIWEGQSEVRSAFWFMVGMLAIGVLLLFSSKCQAKSLVVLGWDGAGYNNLIPLLEQNKLPNLASFLSRGATYSKIESIAETETKPGWSIIWTGMTYDQTKVSSNLNSKPIPYKDTIAYPIQSCGFKVGWVISKNNFGKSGTTPLVSIWNNADYRKHNGPYADNNLILGTRVVHNNNYIYKLRDAALDFIQSNQDFILFLHLDPDQYGHQFGENDERYLDEFIKCDQVLGEIMGVITLDTKILITTDHGFDEGRFTHNNAPDTWMVTDIPIKDIYVNGETVGTMRDIPMTILDYFGIIDWRNDPVKYRGKSLIKSIE